MKQVYMKKIADASTKDGLEYWNEKPDRNEVPNHYWEAEFPKEELKSKENPQEPT